MRWAIAYVGTTNSGLFDSSDPIQTRTCEYFESGHRGTSGGERFIGASPICSNLWNALQDTVTWREQTRSRTQLDGKLVFRLVSETCSSQQPKYQACLAQNTSLFKLLDQIDWRSLAMQITTHRSEKQMQRDYNLRPGTSASRAATERLMNEFASGRMKKMPATAIEKSRDSFAKSALNLPVLF